MEVFYTPVEAQIKAEIWRREYNQIRPHSSLKYMPLDEYRQEYFIVIGCWRIILWFWQASMVDMG